MIKHKPAILLLASITILNITLCYDASYYTEDPSIIKCTGPPEGCSSDMNPIKFDDPDLAYEILTKLDIYESSRPKGEPPANYNYSFFGLKINENYCKEHRRFFVNNPLSVFQNKRFFSDYWPNRLRLVTFRKLGRDVHPKLGYQQEMPENFSVDLSVEINAFYTLHKLNYYRGVGVGFSCLTQTSNKVGGNLDLIKKDNFTNVMRNYRWRYRSRPQCLAPGEYFPDSWVMYDKTQCLKFFMEFNSPEYFRLKKERGVVYMRKIAGFVHMAEGVFPVYQKEENYIRRLYRSGLDCGKVKQHAIMQYMVPNPLLLDGRKFDFRIFLFVASTNPTIAYYYDGNLKVSLHEYDTNSTEPGVFITNIALSKTLFEEAEKNGTYKGLTSEQLRSKVHWTYDDFFNYLWNTGKITDPDWIKNYLRREMKKLLVHVTRMTQRKFDKKSSTSELYGVDLVIDEDLKLWFIEANQKPMIQGWTPEIVPYFDKLLEDSFEVTFGLLKSRIQRIVRYVNQIIREPRSWTRTKNGVLLSNLKERRKEFQQLTMNRFEPEFVPSSKNGFQLIVDENLSGEGRYFGLSEECY